MPESEAAWYVLQSRQKAEPVALRTLQAAGFEAFLPQLRFKRPTVRGPVTFTEPFFPGYLFAWFDWHQSYRHVRSLAGVAGIVQSGDTAPLPAERSVQAAPQKAISYQ